MKHSLVDIKWFYRCLLIVLTLSMTYIVIQPSYNFSHFVPHNLFRSLNIPYTAVLLFEQNADKALHFLGAASLVLLIHGAQVYKITKLHALLFTILLCIAAEAIQLKIGRGFNSSDLLLGILGSFMAYLRIK